jgi:hypothetical protein
MWDLETFIVPPLTLLIPEVARTLLDYRIRHLPAARRNAALLGRAGAAYPWESCPLHGEEVTPGARPPLQEHASLDIALAVSGYMHATGDHDYLRDAWPLLRDVAVFIESRVVRRGHRYRWLGTVGPREDYEPVDDNAFVNMAAIRVLREAQDAANAVGIAPPAAWRRIAERLAIPVADGGWVRNHSKGTLREKQGGAPEAAAGFFPVGYEAAGDLEQHTYRYATRSQAPKFVGMPMLSSLFPVFAARSGDRRASRRLLEDGYAALLQPPFSEIDEFPAQQDKPRASPMFANMGGFLMGLLYGFPNVRLGDGPPSSWVRGPASLPGGWERIHARRVWARREPLSLEICQGVPATFLPAD